MPKFSRNKPRLMPGLSTSSKELVERVKARQVRPDTSGNLHSTDPEVTDAFRKSRVENARDYVSTIDKTEKMKAKISDAENASKILAERKKLADEAKKDSERQAALDKIIEADKSKGNA